MATIVSGNQVKLNNGQTITANTGGWYDGQQFWNGTLSAPGVINSQSNQPGAGGAVNPEVIKQSNPDQGLAAGTNEAFLARQTALYNKQGSGTTGGTAGAGTAGGATSTDVSGGISFTKAPTVNLIEEQKKLYDASGISQLDANAAALNATIEVKKAEADKRRSEVNENPFLSESSRVGRIAKIDQALNDTLQTDQAKLTNLQNSITEKKNEVNNKLGITVQQYNIDKAARQENFATLNSLLSSGALTNATAGDLALLSQEAGVPVSFIQSMVKASQKADIQVVTETNDAGEVTILAIDKNTGQVVNQSNAGRIGKATKSSAGDITMAYKDDAVNTIRGGATLAQVFSIYSGILDPNDIYTIYNANSPYGVAETTNEWTPEILSKYGVTSKQPKVTTIGEGANKVTISE